MIEALVTFALVNLATAFVCTAVKEDEDARLGMNTGRLFVLLSAGIVAFGLVVHGLTLAAGN